MRFPPLFPTPAVAAGLACLLAGCLGIPDVETGGDPMVITAGGPTAVPAGVSPERMAAVADIRARAAAADAMPYPGAFQSDQTARLAARPEPRTVPDVQAIEAELALIAERRAAGAGPAEMAELEARAAELRRLAAAARAAAAGL
ncbi:MAG TPA: hypothetical protein VGA77_03150 [Propylenella sp.]